MAFDAGEIKAKLTVDKSQWDKSTKDINRTQGKMSNQAKKTGTVFKGMWKAVAGGAVAILAIRTAKSLVSSFISVASEVENYRIRLEVLLGSQEAANDALEHFKDVASELPFTLQEVVEAGVKISTVTDEFKKWLIPVADVSAAMGMELPLAADQMVRAFSSGLGACDLFRERGVSQLIRAYAKLKFGIDDLSRVSLPKQREVMYAAFTDIEYKFAGATDKLKDSWIGMVSMLGDAWFQLRADIMEAGIFEMLKEGLQDVIDWIAEFRKAGGFDAISLQISMMVETHKKAVPWWKKFFEYFGPAVFGKAISRIAGAKDETDALAEAQRLLDEALAKAGIKKITGDLEDGEKATKKATGAIKAQLPVVNALAIEYENWGASVYTISEFLKDLEDWKAPVSEFDAILPPMREFFDIVNMIPGAVEGMAISTEKHFSDLSETTQAFYTDIAMAAGEGFAAILGTLKQWAIAEAVKHIFATVPWPASMILATLASFAIGAFYRKITGMEEGGWVGLHGEEIIKVGERGPEYVSSNDTITNIYGGGPPAQLQRIIIQNRITIGEQTFYKESVKSVNKAGELGDLIVPVKVVVP